MNKNKEYVLQIMLTVLMMLMFMILVCLIRVEVRLQKMTELWIIMCGLIIILTAILGWLVYCEKAGEKK